MTNKVLMAQEDALKLIAKAIHQEQYDVALAIVQNCFDSANEFIANLQHRLELWRSIGRLCKAFYPPSELKLIYTNSAWFDLQRAGEID